jgi:hypothetical protein
VRRAKVAFAAVAAVVLALTLFMLLGPVLDVVTSSTDASSTLSASLWSDRALDLLVQAFILLGGAAAVLLLLREEPGGAPPD